MEDIAHQIWLAIVQTSWLERISVICGVIQVILSKNNQVSNYLFGIISICTAIFVLFSAKLYGEIALQGYYLFMSIYGWWFWKYATGTKEQPISSCSNREWQIVLAIVFIGFVFFYFLLEHITNSDVPMWDAWVTSTAWAGMWLLAKRKIENWILLNISNLFAVPLLYHKGLYLFALLTSILFIIAILGYFNWKRLMKKDKEIATL
ncbi:nicotinamide riboside transporter PnuC [Sphingobacterium sp. HJSM2_6]|uniref:nicotinamide riboside transporter PnuC n=1 Tax=Sphingobacterium sp. HJSM2_6 TaxID=3366264 RepID=UPI003BBDBD1C